MWDKILDFGKQIFSLSQKQQKHEEDIKENEKDINTLRQDFNQLRTEVNNLTLIVERLLLEMQHDRKNAENEREMQRLRLENIMLKFERGLPPGRPLTEENIAENN